MKFKQFKCTLLSDVVINQKAATEGKQETLDFIPGSNFLGIAAGELYPDNELSPEQKGLLFHSGLVRFGDAHPALNDKRSLRVPAAWFIPKISNEENRDLLLVHHHIHDFNPYKEEQPKQCRVGFYCFDEQEKIAKEVSVNRTFALKSAYDKNYRRSRDEQMYGYQSLDKGLEFIFEVCINKDKVTSDLQEKIEKSLNGIRRVGRSKTAQYGLVKIESLSDWNTIAKVQFEGNSVVLYADSRLIFLDEYGNSTFTPQPVDFNLRGVDHSAEKPFIDWEKSQIRTFQYAPWNSIRQARDTDRCGIEKGSVIVVRNVKWSDDFNGYVGFYQNEGFGKVLVNPSFLESQGENANGKALYKFERKESIKSLSQEEEENAVEEEIGQLKQSEDKLLKYLGVRKEQEFIRNKIYKLVNGFLENKENIHPFISKDKEKFASQWGTIRNIAMRSLSYEELHQQLFEGPNAYLKHGIAKEKWEEYDRIGILNRFFTSLDEEYARLALVNLAAEMAKKCGGRKYE